jgi:protein-disulfide isomerase
VRVVLKDFPLAVHELARSAHEAARCAGAQDRYWEYHDRLYAEQPRFERARLVQYAVDLGLDAERFGRCLDERRFAAAVTDDIAQARALGITSTPTFLINGQVLVGAQSVEAFRTAVADALRRR